MDNNKQFDALQRCTKDFNLVERLRNNDFIKNRSTRIINLIENKFTEDNFKNGPDSFNFWNEHFFNIAKTVKCQTVDLLQLVNSSTCTSTSSVLVEKTVSEQLTSCNEVYLQFIVINFFRNFEKMNDENLKKILPIVIKHLLKFKGEFQRCQQLINLFYKFAYFALRANIDLVEFVDIFSSVIYDPFSLLETRLGCIEEETFLASFYYLYFKTGGMWGPKVYNRLYILEKCLNLALLVFKNDIFEAPFVNLMLSKFKDNSIPLRMLNECHKKFVIKAAGSAVNNDDFSVKKDSTEILILYLNKLSGEAQYDIFMYAFGTLDTKIKAHMIITMKNLLCSKIESNKDIRHFQGMRFLKLIHSSCNIPKGSKCDVVDNKEYILAVITVIYVLYAFIDKLICLGNPYVDYLNGFVETIQNAINYTKKQCLKGNRKLCDKNDKDMKLTESEKKDMLLQCNTTILMIQTNLNLLKEKLSYNN